MRKGSLVEARARMLIKNGLKMWVQDEVSRKRVDVATNNLQALTQFARKRSRVGILDYRAILACKAHWSREIYIGNSSYGIAEALRGFSGFDQSIFACVEHGVYFGSRVIGAEAWDSGLPGMLTFSEVRVSHIQRVTDKPAFAIGPYISYANSALLPEEFVQMREMLGRVLLVFPAHSVTFESKEFDVESFVMRVRQIRDEGEFDTVLYCLYYVDIDNGRHLEYERLGERVVSAGRVRDPAFLPRLKALIELSEGTVSNAVGTHIGYSLALGKPHTLLSQPIAVRERTSGGRSEGGSASELASRDEEMAEVAVHFNGHVGPITNDQLSVCNKYWGFEKLRSPEELRGLLERFHDAARRASGQGPGKVVF